MDSLSSSVRGRRAPFYWNKAIQDGFVPGNAFPVEESGREGNPHHVSALRRRSDGGVAKVSRTSRRGDALYFSTDFRSFTKKADKVSPPKNIDVIMLRPKARAFRCELTFWTGAASTPALPCFQDFTGQGKGEDAALGIAIGSDIFSPPPLKKSLQRSHGREGCSWAACRRDGSQYDLLRKKRPFPSEAFNETLKS